MTGGGMNVDARGSTATGFVFKGSSGGDGKDTLASTSFTLTASVVNGSSGFEVLESVSPTGNLVANSFTSIHEFLFSGGDHNGRVEISGVETNDRFVFSSDQSNRTGAIRFTGSSIGQPVVMELRASSEDDGAVSIQTRHTAEDARSAIAFDKITSVTIDSTGQNSHANLIEAVKTESCALKDFPSSFGLWPGASLVPDADLLSAERRPAGSGVQKVHRSARGSAAGCGR